MFQLSNRSKRAREGHRNSESENKNKETTQSDDDGSKSTEKKPKSKSAISRCCSWLKYFILMLFIPPFLNYAALHQEQRFLQLPGTVSNYCVNKVYFNLRLKLSKKWGKKKDFKLVLEKK